MDNIIKTDKVLGAWVVHHGLKLQKVSVQTNELDQIAFAAKCGQLLNGLGASEQIKITSEKAKTIAGVAGINIKSELPTILTELKNNGYVDYNDSAIEIIGITTSSTLSHTAKIFRNSEPTKIEMAAICGSEIVSENPQSKATIREFLADEFKISKKEISSAIDLFTDVGFVDAEKCSDSEEILFNGNLFRKDHVKKASAVLAALTGKEQSTVNSFMSTLNERGCIPYADSEKMLGKELIQKLLSIGLIDENKIENNLGTHSFITKPSAFNKFGSEQIEDAFDLAKAFVASLTYGMLQSTSGRGRIKMFELLMRKLINGGVVGPATAIGQDYKVLEGRRVVQVIPESNGMYSMKLLKKDIGEIALKVIQQGEVSTSMFENMPSVSAINYLGPEVNRVVTRKRQSTQSKASIAKMIETLRTGAI